MTSARREFSAACGTRRGRSISPVPPDHLEKPWSLHSGRITSSPWEGLYLEANFIASRSEDTAHNGAGTFPDERYAGGCVQLP